MNKIELKTDSSSDNVLLHLFIDDKPITSYSVADIDFNKAMYIAEDVVRYAMELRGLDE